MNVKVHLEKDEDGFYTASCLSLPGCISQGKTKEEALKNMEEAISLHIKMLMEDGLPINQTEQNNYILQVNV